MHRQFYIVCRILVFPLRQQLVVIMSLCFLSKPEWKLHKNNARVVWKHSVKLGCEVLFCYLVYAALQTWNMQCHIHTVPFPVANIWLQINWDLKTCWLHTCISFSIYQWQTGWDPEHWAEGPRLHNQKSKSRGPKGQKKTQSSALFCQSLLDLWKEPGQTAWWKRSCCLPRLQWGTYHQQVQR